MPNPTETEAGVVRSLWRYPVKSMQGEELNAADATDYGLAGDRAYALIDGSDHKVATAKNPKKWPALFAFRAGFDGPLGSDAALPPVSITLPSGAILTSAQSDLNQMLSDALGRDVTLASAEHGRVTAILPSTSEGWTAYSEEYWPDIEGLDHRDTVTAFALPEGTFFDGATIHLLTTATLDHLRSLYPEGEFEVQRFRPNIVVDTAPGESGFAENAWIGATLAIGEEVRLRITGPAPRCVMPTLAQGQLPKDTGILRTAVQYNHGNVGVYAAVVSGGAIRRGDRVRITA